MAAYVAQDNVTVLSLKESVADKMIKAKFRLFLSLCLLLPILSFTAASPALAQDGAAKTTSHKDWVVRCIEREALPPCDAVQSMSSSETGEQVMFTSFAYLGSDDQIGIQIWVPTGILVSAGVLVEVDESEQVLDALQFTRCEANGCFIEAIIGEADLLPLKKGANAAVAVLASTGEPRIVGLSLSGFTKAYEDVKKANQAWYAGR